jgi:hypothetical protein
MTPDLSGDVQTETRRRHSKWLALLGSLLAIAILLRPRRASAPSGTSAAATNSSRIPKLCVPFTISFAPKYRYSVSNESR